MTQPNEEHANQIIEKILPRFPKQWHHQLKRIAKDSFTAWVVGGADGADVPAEVVYTIKSGKAMLMVRSNWRHTGADFLMLALDIIHSRGAEAIKLS